MTLPAALWLLVGIGTFALAVFLDLTREWR